MKTNFLFKIMLLFFILAFNSCEKDEDYNADYLDDATTEVPTEEPFTGSVSDIEALLGSGNYQIITQSGFKVYTGDNPPRVNGQYVIDEARLKASTVPGDQVNQYFLPYNISYSNFNLDALTVDFKGKQGGQSDEGKGIFISGDSKFFTSIRVNVSTYNFEDAKSAVLISGKLTDQGIKDCQFMYIMVDNYGNPSGQWIEEGSYRIIYDVDGMAEKI